MLPERSGPHLQNRQFDGRPWLVPTEAPTLFLNACCTSGLALAGTAATLRNFIPRQQPDRLFRIRVPMQHRKVVPRAAGLAEHDQKRVGGLSQGRTRPARIPMIASAAIRIITREDASDAGVRSTSDSIVLAARGPAETAASLGIGWSGEKRITSTVYLGGRALLTRTRFSQAPTRDLILRRSART